MCPCTKAQPTMPTQQSPLHSEPASEPPSEPDRTVYPGYTIYLLTVWHEEKSDDDPSLWRFRLENPRTKDHWAGVGTSALADGLVNLVRHETDLFLVMDKGEANANDKQS